MTYISQDVPSLRDRCLGAGPRAEEAQGQQPRPRASELLRPPQRSIGSDEVMPMFLTRSRWTGRLTAYYAAVLIWLITTAMHIPDGYLSPVTSLVMLLLVLPFWVRGLRKIRQTMDARSVPLIALLAAFSFVIMMFNVPLPGGTTGHAVGAGLAGIILGPEVAALSVSVALIIQAFFFGDGGILALGANCFNMAVVESYVAFGVYRLLSGGSPLGSVRRLVGAGLGGWSGLTVSALFAGIEFGIQPLLFHTTDGTPLYAPYPLSISVPAMVVPHALVASVVEAVLTVLVIAYLQRTNMGILEAAESPSIGGTAGTRRGLHGLWLILGILIVASPFGLLAPGTAWGEWGTSELESLGLPAIPEGLQKLSSLWGAPLAGYRLPVLGNANLGYVVSAVLGTIVIAVLMWLFVVLATGSLARPRSDK
jgi:cobalt/nickel transport system permease protein